MNASDVRNKKSLEEHLATLLGNTTMTQFYGNASMRKQVFACKRDVMTVLFGWCWSCRNATHSCGSDVDGWLMYPCREPYHNISMHLYVCMCGLNANQGFLRSAIFDLDQRFCRVPFSTTLVLLSWSIMFLFTSHRSPQHSSATNKGEPHLVFSYLP